MSKYDFACQNRIFRLGANVKIGFLMSKQEFPTECECQNKIFRLTANGKIGFDIRTESENCILYSKSYFDIGPESESPILTFAVSRKILLWYSKSYFDIGPESENPILIFKSYFDIRYQSENPILTFKIIFWHSHFWHFRLKANVQIWFSDS